jgi:uncharacterized surface protein with fasciclin (FAS1) repeats
MKTLNSLKLFVTVTGYVLFAACGSADQAKTEETATTTAATTETPTGQSGVQDDVSQKNIVGVAISSPDHTTLVQAVQAGELVDALSNAGPFTVFAPTNAAFSALPAGTVEDLLKPENKEKLQDILQYHVALAVYQPDQFTDGQVLNMVNGGNVTMGVKDGKVTINGANIVGTVTASNGIIHVIDAVLLPK